MDISPPVCRLIMLARLTSSSSFQLLLKLEAAAGWAQRVWKRTGSRYRSRRSHWLFFQKQLDTIAFSFKSCPSGFASDEFQSSASAPPHSAHAPLHIIISPFSGVLWRGSWSRGVFNHSHVCGPDLTCVSPPPQASSSGWTVHLSAAPGSWAPGCRGSRVPAAWTWPCSCPPSEAANTPFGW